MFVPLPPSVYKNPQQATFKVDCDRSGLIRGIEITSIGSKIYIPVKSYDFLKQFDQKLNQHSFQNLTDLAKSISRQSTYQEAQQRAPEPQKQASAEPPPSKAQQPQRSPPPENVPRQTESQRQPPPSGGDTKPSPSAGQAGDGGSSLPAPAKTEKNTPPSSSQLAPSLPAPAKGAPLPPGQEFSGEKKAMMYQQVLLASRLFTSSERREESPLSVSRIFLFVEQFKSLAQDCEKFGALVRQMGGKNQGLSPEQRKQLNTALQTLLKEFQGVQKQAQEAMPQLQKVPVDQALPKDLQQALAMLKERCEQSASHMQNQLDAKLAKLATSSPSLDKEIVAKSDQKLAAEQRASVAQAAATSSEKGERPAMSFVPSLPASESLTQGAAEARSVGAKSSTQPPQIIQSSTDLQVFNDKLQKRELHAPLNITVVYPLHTKEQSASSVGGKTAAERGGKGEKSSEGFATGGGKRSQEMVLIPAGSVLLEGPFSNEEKIVSQIVELDAFLIAAFPVTNEQFADWLNEALAEGKIKIDEKGIVRDIHRNILCKTHWAAPTSQIETEVSQGQMLFKPLKGTQRHPIVQISWFGAIAYCKDNSFRLPTEAEWEKAAGMSPDQPKKFRYGFGKDEVDLSWANYRDELKPHEDNRTSPVGFYNGETVFTKGGKNYQSQNAVSPFGCYDMSGNVRQWTDDEEKSQKVTKGGSYNSPPSELAVPSRIAHTPETCLPDTGFRVALDL